MPETRLPPPDAPVGPYFPAGFRLATGATAGETLHPAARFLFAGETIAVPSTPPFADYSRGVDPFADVAAWAAEPGAAHLAAAGVDRRPGATDRRDRIAPDGRSFRAGSATLPLALAPRIALNRSWADASTFEYSRRTHGHRCEARSVPAASSSRARSGRRTGAWTTGRRPCPFPHRARPGSPSAGSCAARPAAAPPRRPRPTRCGSACAATATGPAARCSPSSSTGPRATTTRPGAGTSRSPPGACPRTAASRTCWSRTSTRSTARARRAILPAPVPLDNYLADVNSGQAWYRPSYVMLAILRDARAADLVQGALNRLYLQFWRRQLEYRHSSMNCASISVDTLRALGWELPLARALRHASRLARGAREGVHRRAPRPRAHGLRVPHGGPHAAHARGGVRGSGLLAAAAARAARSLPRESSRACSPRTWSRSSGVRMPQIPSSRALGTWPAASPREYLNALPADPADLKVIPVPPRPFPPELRDADLRPAPAAAIQPAHRAVGRDRHPAARVDRGRAVAGASTRAPVTQAARPRTPSQRSFAPTIDEHRVGDAVEELLRQPAHEPHAQPDAEGRERREGERGERGSSRRRARARGRARASPR